MKTDAVGRVEVGGVNQNVTVALGAPSLTFYDAYLDTSTSGDNLVITNTTSGTAITVHGYAISCGSTATDVYFKSTTGTQETHTMQFGANGGTVEPRSIIPCFSCPTGESLYVNLSDSNAVNVSIYYRIV